MMNSRRTLLIALTGAGALGAAGAARAQAYPGGPVRLIVPNAPGGSIDILARLLAQHLQPIWGQSVVVDYKPGAGTALGTDVVAKSAPDGLTLGMVVTAHVINPSMRKLAFDTVRDLSGISLTAVSHVAIVATPSFEANTIPELIALARKQPGKIAYASPGSGSAMHLAGELLASQAGLQLVHVPYKGNGPAYIDVIAGRVPLLIDPLFASMAHLKAGRLKPIAIASPARAAIAPDIPTIAETLPGFNVQSVNGIVVPSGTPRELVQRINTDLLKVLALPEVRARMAEYGLEVIGSTPEQFDAFVRTEIDKWAKVVKASGATLD
jgi:tripartite-type tricarboxylate transporter receptor subunit TctC